MRVELRKQPKKFLLNCTQDTYEKVMDALAGLEELNGDIIKLQGRKDEYRLKIPPYRILFKYDKVEKCIEVTKIGMRGDVYK